MLWGHNKQIRESLDAILMRINRMDETLKDFRDNARRTHADDIAFNRGIFDKVEKMGKDIETLLPPKKEKGRGGRKPKEAVTP